MSSKVYFDDVLMDGRAVAEAEAEALAAVEREVDAEAEAETVLKLNDIERLIKYCPLKFSAYFAGCLANRRCEKDSCAWWNSQWQGCCLEALADILRLIYEEKPNLWKE